MSKTKHAIFEGRFPGPKCPACGANVRQDAAGGSCLVCSWTGQPDDSTFILTAYDEHGACVNGTSVQGEVRAFETSEKWKRNPRVSRVTVDEVNGMKARRRRLEANGC